VRSLFGSSWRWGVCRRDDGGGLGISIERWWMLDQRFAVAGEAPQPARGDRERRPVGWTGESVKVSRALK
jgi:hypothetical protein